MGKNEGGERTFQIDGRSNGKSRTYREDQQRIRQHRTVTIMYTPRNPYFSEFSYGYAVTEDLIIGPGSSVTIAPIFPSLIEEGRVGYDVFLDRNGIPLFLQFKLAHRIVRSYAMEALRGYFVPPFFRMHLRCIGDSNQHALLLALENEGQDVFYTAPAFHLREQLDEAYRTRQVWNRSFQIRPSEIGPRSQEEHHVSFQKPGRWQVFSDESDRGGEASESEAIRSKLENDLRSKKSTPLRNQLHNLDSAMLKIFAEQRGKTVGWDTVSVDKLEADLTPLQRISYLARSFFDCQFFVATQKVRP